MEPMDLDEDSMGESPTRSARSASVAFPSQSLWTQRTQHAVPQFLSHSLPVSRQNSRTNLAYNSPRPLVPKETASSFCWNSPSMGFSPVPEAHQRRGTPVPGLASCAASRPGSPDDGVESPNSSGRSDVSDMDVGHCSPSPSWDRVISALGSISVFRSGSEVNHKAAEKQAADERHRTSTPDQGGGITSTDSRSSWEPGLTAVQAAAAFKRRKPERKGCSSHTLPATASESKTDAQRSSTPLRKLAKSSRRDSADANESIKRKGPGDVTDVKPDTSDSGGKSTCSKCITLLPVLILSIGMLCALLFHIQAADRCEKFARMDAELLRNEMASKLFGQHIAMEVVPGEVQSYLDSFRRNAERCKDENCTVTPPLVLSFHGWTGVGKNFVSDIISNVFPLRTVLKFLIPYHFPHQHMDDVYRAQIEEWVLSNVTDYAVNFFVFDEMDKASPGVVQGIKNVVLKLNNSKQYIHSPTIFLLLSNSLGSDINRLLFQSMTAGHERDTVTVDDFASLFSSCEDEWFQQLSPSVITRAVPFLPLEKQHVVQCIRRDLVSKKLSTHADIISRVLKELTFTTLSSGHQFSQTGCKRVADKVDYVTVE